MPDTLDLLASLYARIGAISLDARQTSPHWPKTWRCREAGVNRPRTTWGDSPREAVLAMVEKIDVATAGRSPS